MKKRRRSPQEKKALSYAKDRRNRYFENDKASRKNIPRSKARASRAVRRLDKLAIRSDPTADKISPARPKPNWKKSPDMELGRVLLHRETESDFVNSDIDGYYAEEESRFRKRIRALKKQG